MWLTVLRRGAPRRLRTGETAPPLSCPAWAAVYNRLGRDLHVNLPPGWKSTRPPAHVHRHAADDRNHRLPPLQECRSPYVMTDVRKCVMRTTRAEHTQAFLNAPSQQAAWLAARIKSVDTEAVAVLMKSRDAT